MKGEQPNALSEFFSQLSGEYDLSIIRACPPYLEMLESLMVYTFAERALPLRILELGCGTGNVSRLIGETFPKAELWVVDLSAEMLQETLNKITPLGIQVHGVQGNAEHVESLDLHGVERGSFAKRARKVRPVPLPAGSPSTAPRQTARRASPTAGHDHTRKKRRKAPAMVHAMR